MNGIFKFGLTTLAFAGFLSVPTTMAEAKGFSAGTYSLVEQPIVSATLCLRANGTFFQAGRGNVTGRWVNRTLNGTTTGFLWGNDPSGNINVSVVALGVANSKVTQWSDTDLFPASAANAVRITKLSSACTVMAPQFGRFGAPFSR